jgi:DNA-binding PadR family transcriptional regulator
MSNVLIYHNVIYFPVIYGVLNEDIALDMIRSSIILLLSEKPLHGYGIMKEVKNRTGRPVNPGLLYPFLKKLENNELVRSTNKPVGQKQKTVYELTPSGKKLATRIYTRIASMISMAIEPNLNICFHCGCKIYEGGHREIIGTSEKTFCCVHCAQVYKNEVSFPPKQQKNQTGET